MNKQFKTTIGGQALIEGIMMRGPQKTVMAVRQPDGAVKIEDIAQFTKKWYHKVPFIRGAFNLVSSLMLGYRCLMRSAEIAGAEEEEQPTKFEEWLSKTFGASLATVVAVVAMVLGLGIAIGLFMVLPSLLTGLLRPWLPTQLLRSLVEGVIKISLFLAYLAAVARVPDIRRVFGYHGAEHKTIACYEAQEELTVENVRAKKRLHPRCGTSFLLIVMVVSILLFSVVTWNSVLVRVALKILMLPLVVGIAYEIIQLAGRYDNILTRIISAPGLWLQNLTTNEPDDSMIEVAIASMLPVIPEEKGDDEW